MVAWTVRPWTRGKARVPVWDPRAIAASTEGGGIGNYSCLGVPGPFPLWIQILPSEPIPRWVAKATVLRWLALAVTMLAVRVTIAVAFATETTLARAVLVRVAAPCGVAAQKALARLVAPAVVAAKEERRRATFLAVEVPCGLAVLELAAAEALCGLLVTRRRLLGS